MFSRGYVPVVVVFALVAGGCPSPPAPPLHPTDSGGSPPMDAASDAPTPDAPDVAPDAAVGD